MKTELFIAYRYLTGKRKEKFISIISAISIIGVAVGVAALIIVLAVMSGFDRELKEKIVGTNAHISIEGIGGVDNPGELIKKAYENPEVLGASPFIAGQSIIKSQIGIVGVVVRAIDPLTEPKVTRIKEYVKEGRLDIKDKGLIIGSQLAARLGVGIGGKLDMISTVGGKVYSFNVEGIFNSGMYEYDANVVLMKINDAQAFYNIGSRVGGIGVKIRDIDMSNKVRGQLQRKIGYSYFVRTWMDLNKNLFSAIKLEKTVMFLILTLIVMVACFNIVSTLIMMVNEKARDIGVLKSIGMNDFGIMNIFAIQGLMIGLIGTALGTSFGLGMCALLKEFKFIKLPADVYYIESLPVAINWSDSTLIIVAAVCLALISCIYPAVKASRLSPVSALRYE